MRRYWRRQSVGFALLAAAENRLRALAARVDAMVFDSNDFGQAIPVLAAFSRYSANSTGSGAFVDVSVPTLLVPDTLSVQCSAAGAYPSTNPQVGCRP